MPRYYEDWEVELLARLYIKYDGARAPIFDEFRAQNPKRSTGAIDRKINTPQIQERVEQILRERGTPTPTAEDVARHLAGEAVPGVFDGPPIIEPAAGPTHHHDPERLWERAKAETRSARRYHKDRGKATVSFVTDKPVGFTFISDQHISEGAPVNMDRMEHDAKLTRDTPGMYAVLGGDGVDNHIKHRQAIIASGSKPGREWELYDHYLGLFGNKIAGMCSGNHDDWTKDFTDFDVVGSLAQKHRIFYAPDCVVLDVFLRADAEQSDEEAQHYRLKVRHIYRYNSSFNTTHAVKRMWEMDDDDFDVGVVCHHHEAGMEPFVKHGLVRLAFRPGSYQHTSGFSRRYGYKWANPSCPTVILFPDFRWLIGFWDIREAAIMLNTLRANWPQVAAPLQGLADEFK